MMVHLYPVAFAARHRWPVSTHEISTSPDLGKRDHGLTCPPNPVHFLGMQVTTISTGNPYSNSILKNLDSVGSVNNDAFHFFIART